MRNTRRIASALSLCLLLLAGVTASAKVKSRTVAFKEDVTIGGTVVKGGIYRLSFDDKTNELIVADNGTRAEVARVAVRVERRNDAPQTTDLQLARQGGAMVLTGVAFSGEKWNLNIGAASERASN